MTKTANNEEKKKKIEFICSVEYFDDSNCEWVFQCDCFILYMKNIFILLSIGNILTNFMKKIRFACV